MCEEPELPLSMESIEPTTPDSLEQCGLDPREEVRDRRLISLRRDQMDFIRDTFLKLWASTDRADLKEKYLDFADRFDPRRSCI